MTESAPLASRTVVGMAPALHGGFPGGLAGAGSGDGERAAGKRTVVEMAPAPYGGFPGGVARRAPGDGERVACGAFRCSNGDSPLRGVQGGVASGAPDLTLPIFHEIFIENRIFNIRCFKTTQDSLRRHKMAQHVPQEALGKPQEAPRRPPGGPGRAL